MTTMPKDAMPAGSRAPESGSGQSQLPGMETQNTGSGEDDKGNKGADKFEGKSREDVIQSYTSLETKIGEQGEELGKTRGELKDSQAAQQRMSGRMEAMEGREKPAAKEEPARDFDKDLDKITEQIDKGEIELSEGIRQSSEITRERTLGEAREIYSELDQERETSRTIDDFKKNNADFEQVRASGALDIIRQQNPMHDDFSAYYALKAQQAEVTGQTAVEEAYQKGLTEKQNLAAGVNVTDDVLKKPGSEMRQTTTPQGPITGDQRRSSMLAALKRSRE